MAGENEKKCDCPEDKKEAPYSEALEVLREAHLNFLRELWKAEQNAMWFSASMHAVHTGMFNMERQFIEIATISMEEGNGSSGKRDD